MTSTVPDLSVPDAALTRLGEAVYRWEVSGQNEEAVREAVRAVAAPVVAAELRRIRAYLADHVQEAIAEGDRRYGKAMKDAARHLRDRAAELDPEETP